MLTVLERLENRLFSESRDMGPPWGATLRALRYPAAVIRDWLAGDLSVRAMSLAYTTLLSLVPLMVFSFAILKGVGARTDLHFILREFFRPLGAGADQATANVLEFVTNMRADVLGSLGLLFLTYTVVSTIQKVESSFNFLWRVDRPRKLARRFTEYLSVMIAGPILLAVALGLLGSAKHSEAAAWLDSIAPLAWVLRSIAQLVPYAIVSLVFTFMYMFIPNTRVEFRPALAGGVTAGIVWALVGKIFTAILVNSSQMMAVYTGFAIVLTTLVWVYTSWLILLLGAQLAFYLQFPQYLRHGHDPVEMPCSAREQAGLSVMYLIARDFRRGTTPWTAQRLAAELDVPGSALAPVLACLEKSRLIVATEKEQYVPGREPTGIELRAIIEAVRSQAVGRLAIVGRSLPPAARVMDELEAALRAKLGARSLDELL